MRRISWFALRGAPRVIGNAFRYLAPLDAVLILLAYTGVRHFTAPSARLRTGGSIPISSPIDVTTLVVIFLRGDYGQVEPGATVVDVGANVGLFSIWAGLCGAGRVVALEPEPGNFAVLLNNGKALIDAGVLQVLPVGVAAESVERSLVIRDSPTHSLYASNTAESAGAISVQCLSLDDVLTQTGIRNIDFLKMDIEGGEYEVLYGASHDVFERIRNIRLEYHNLDDVRLNNSALRVHLEECGFTVTREAPISPASGMLWLRRN